jgi:hypothetical protein
MWQRAIVFGAVMALHTGVVRAEGHAVAAKAGFLGLGVEYTYQLSERLSFRAGVNGSEYGFDGVESGIRYDFDLIWDSLSFAVDFHPRKSPLRITGGFLSNDNGLEAISRPAGDITVGGATYTPAEVGTLSAAIEFDSTAPFVGLGWDWSRNKRRFGVSFDLGVVSQGEPRLSLVADGALIGDATFQSDIEAERLELQASLDDFDLLPYATLGFVFRF